eukprot:TRINITY_DN1235_c0_g1_i4.p1 TRINITY_DN1235_c0_g1~~TRINITY_DN1235_c0_g1_i4.p1  ORF type:complete len:677 (-),score=191.42 TRINITY_DN1235_c0_g1_i4:966-2996(-)
MTSLVTKLNSANETTWMRLGSLSELMHDPDKAMFSYENALRHNPCNIKALTQIASICRLREQYPKAVEFFQRILNIENNNGEIWGALGHCYLMMDDLQKAYTAYQQALYHLPNPKDPNLWYGIGILYDRYGSFEHAEEAFTAVLKMDPKFEKSNEIYFRLGIIYKQQLKYDQALECFRYILAKPPRPLTQGDIYFQIGHVYELQKDFNSAKESYEKVLKETPNHAKALQQLGWLYHSNTSIGHQDVAINYLMRSIDTDPNDGQTWYLLGRCYMAQQQYRKAYDAYQQAVYRDGRNPTFWCSIGVLYYQINQYRDALDAYSRAIRLNPYLSEVWYDLGTLYESCNQISDSLDAYQRAAELDPTNKHIQQRLTSLREAQSNPSSKNGPSNDQADREKGLGNKDKAPMSTLEPRTTGERPRSPRVIPQNIPAVADLVDLAASDEKRTLPSAHDLNNPMRGPGQKRDDLGSTPVGSLEQYKYRDSMKVDGLPPINGSRPDSQRMDVMDIDARNKNPNSGLHNLPPLKSVPEPSSDPSLSTSLNDTIKVEGEPPSRPAILTERKQQPNLPPAPTPERPAESTTQEKPQEVVDVEGSKESASSVDDKKDQASALEKPEDSAAEVTEPSATNNGEQTNTGKTSNGEEGEESKKRQAEDKSDSEESRHTKKAKTEDEDEPSRRR